MNTYTHLNDNELSALVAERIMGYTVQWFDRCYSGNSDEWSQNPVASKEACRHTPVAYWRDTEGRSLDTVCDWNSATDYTAAFMVVDKMPHFDAIRLPGGHYQVTLKQCAGGGGDFHVIKDNCCVYAEAPTIQRAICLAALACVGGEGE